MNYAALILPIFCCIVIIFGLFKKVDVFSAFVAGAKGGIGVTLRIMPYVIGMVFAIDIFKASGVFDLISSALSGLTDRIGIPSEILPIALMRPFSGGASIGLLSGLLIKYGADSYIGRVSSVYMGSSETLMYTVTLYLGSIGIKKTRYIIPVALLCDLLGIIVSCILVKLLF